MATEHAASSLPEETGRPTDTGIQGTSPVDAAMAESQLVRLEPVVVVEPQPIVTGNAPAGTPPGGSEVASHPMHPLRWREILAVVALVVLGDVTLFRGQGFAGYAAMFLLAPALLVWGSPRPRLQASFWVAGLMMLALAGRMVWLGSALGVAAGIALLVALALAITGRRPYVLDVLVCAVQTGWAAYRGLLDYQRSMEQLRLKVPRVYLLGVALPLAAIAAFGTLFVLANPDLASSFADLMSRFFRTLLDWAQRFMPSWGEILFWCVACWIAIGLLRPVLRQSVLSRFASKPPRASGESGMPAETPLYAAVRNMLAAVIGLFAIYLAFEFQTLWFHEFPKVFYYAGYAHQGAAWLTAALALATVVLSLVFRGRVLDDPRLPRLRRLAWLWSAENLILAAAVYHRLWIYVGFNGMTRMRTVGLFGTSAVVVGFVLVVWKIAYQRDFVWLLRRHLWTLALAAYLFVLTPVDALVHAYNVRRVLAGDSAPSVQIGWHPVDAEGLLMLRPLTYSNDKIIREGIQALLAERAGRSQTAWERSGHDWTTFQLADEVLSARLDAMPTERQPWADPAKREAAWQRFRAYVYQWY